MDAFNYHSFNHLASDVSAILFASAKQDILKFQASVTLLTETIGHVRQHRALMHAALSAEFFDRDALNRVQHALASCASEISKSRVIGKKIDRIALKAQLTHLVDSAGQLALAKSLVVHGKVIRQLIYQIDEQMLAAMTKTNKLHLAGEYNESWQRIMSAIDALTQYRLAIVAMHIEPRASRLDECAKTLYAKLLKVGHSYNSYHPQLEQCIARLEICTKQASFVADQQQALYLLCSDTSAALIDIYKQITEYTCLKVFNACVE